MFTPPKSQYPEPQPTLPSAANDVLPSIFAQEIVRYLGATQVDDKQMTDAERSRRWQAAYEALMSFVPSEPVEAMLAAQVVAAHTGAMEAFRRAMVSFLDETARARLWSAATSLMRSYAASLRELERHRALVAASQTTVTRTLNSRTTSNRILSGHTIGGQRNRH